MCSLRLCVIFFYDTTQRHREHREKTERLCALFVFFAALCDFFFMTPHKGTENTEKRQKDFVPSLCSLWLCVNFFYDTTQRHREQREQREKTGRLCALSVFSAALCEFFFMLSHKSTENTGKRQKGSVPLCVLCGSV